MGGRLKIECMPSPNRTPNPPHHPPSCHRAQHNQEEEKEDGQGGDDGQEDEEEEEGEVLRPLGGFERFFGTYQSMGLGLIFFIADIEGPVDTDVRAWCRLFGWRGCCVWVSLFVVVVGGGE